MRSAKIPNGPVEACWKIAEGERHGAGEGLGRVPLRRRSEAKLRWSEYIGLGHGQRNLQPQGPFGDPEGKSTCPWWNLTSVVWQLASTPRAYGLMVSERVNRS